MEENYVALFMCCLLAVLVADAELQPFSEPLLAVQVLGVDPQRVGAALGDGMKMLIACGRKKVKVYAEMSLEPHCNFIYLFKSMCDITSITKL